MKKEIGAYNMLAKTNIGENTYVRQRLKPEHGDPHYLHLSDLRCALDLVPRPDLSARLLDYGCGGSPYRELFPAQVYHRADFVGFPNLDYELSENSTISAPKDSYDIILSTQVLEHVQSPSTYLGECYRLLRPGGKLILSTHGTYEDHGCPYDFHRWTADGLKIALEKAGFRVLTLRKLTCGVRALVYLACIMQRKLVTPDRTLLGLGLRVLQRILRNYPREINSFCDRAFPATDRISEITSDTYGPNFYISLLVEAEKS